MAWRDRLLPASYRGAAFHVASHTAEAAGRRAAVHEYPGRDLPYAEDLGRRASEYTLQAYVLGPDYDRARDALVGACALPGPGRLVHPWLGERQVVCTGCTVSERTDEGGMARVTLRLVEAVPVAVLPDDAPAPLIARARILRLKEPVMDKQWRHHHDGRSGKWSPRHYEIPIEWYADIQVLVDRITPRVQRRRTRTGRVVTRWVYEDPRSGQRLVVGVDKDDGVPIVLSLHRAAVE